MLPPDVISMRRPTLSGSNVKDWVRQGGRGLDFQASTGLSYAIPSVFTRQELTLLAWMARTGSRAGYMAALRLERSAGDSQGLFQVGRSSSHVPQAWIGGSNGYASVTGTTTIGADVPFLAGATFDGSTVKVQHNARQEGSVAAARTLSGLDVLWLSRPAEPAHGTVFMAAVLEGVFQDDDQLAFLEAPFNLFRPYAPIFHSFAVPARDVALDGSLAAGSDAAASLAVVRTLSGSVVADSVVGSNLPIARGLAAPLMASTALAVALARVSSLSGTIGTMSAIAGDAGVTRPFSADGDGETSAGGLLGISRALDAALATLSASLADLSAGSGFGTALVALSVLTSELSVDRGLECDAAPESNAGGALAVARGFTSDIAAISSIATGLSSARALAGISAASSLSDADVVVARGLLVALAAASTLSAQGAIDRRLTGSLAAASALTGTLVMPAPGDPITIGPPWLRAGTAAPRPSAPSAAVRPASLAAMPRQPDPSAEPRRR
ncbi:MAG: hypothetical protein AB7O88_24345 [Reyranellaceae bacterium]